MAAATDFISLLQITDTHILRSPEHTLLGVDTAHYFNIVLDSAINSNRKFDLCLATGDLAQDSAPESYRYLLNKLAQLEFSTICLPGNHDNLNAMQHVFCTKTVNCRKHIILGNWQIIALYSQVPDSAGGHLATEELTFLEQCLIINAELFSLIAVHHHCVPTGSIWMDTMIIDNAPDLFGLIKRHSNVKAIINGHIHQAMDIEINSLRILTTPSTCFQFEPQSDHFSLDGESPGYRWLNLYEDGSIGTGVVRIPEQLTGLQTNTEGY